MRIQPSSDYFKFHRELMGFDVFIRNKFVPKFIVYLKKYHPQDLLDGYHSEVVLKHRIRNYP